MIKLRVAVTTGGKIAFEKKTIKRVLFKAASEITAEAARSIRSSSGGGRTYKGRSASKPGAPPANRTGKLASSFRIKLYRNGLGAVIKDTAAYATALEAGAEGGIGSGIAGVKGKRNKRVTKRRLAKVVVGKRIMAARPFLSVALDRRRAGLDRDLRAAADADFDWVPGK